MCQNRQKLAGKDTAQRPAARCLREALLRLPGRTRARTPERLPGQVQALWPAASPGSPTSWAEACTWAGGPRDRNGLEATTTFPRGCIAQGTYRVRWVCHGGNSSGGCLRGSPQDLLSSPSKTGPALHAGQAQRLVRPGGQARAQPGPQWSGLVGNKVFAEATKFRGGLIQHDRCLCKKREAWTQTDTRRTPCDSRAWGDGCTSQGARVSEQSA